MQVQPNIKKEQFILVVENDNDTLKFIESSLESDNFNIIKTKTSSEALEAIRSVDINIIISDYYLNFSTADEIIDKIKKENLNIPLVIISVTSDIKKEILDRGVNFFISLPFYSWELKSVVDNLLSLFNARKELESANTVIEALSTAVEVRDPYTQGHSLAVADLSLKIYDRLDFNFANEINTLYIGCLLHDIGKIGIPDDILKSEKHPLTDEDFALIKQHPERGWEICKDLKGVEASLDIILYHHEKLDGSGYPFGIAGDSIPMLVQIVTVADIYDALASERSYRRKLTSDEAFAIMDKDAEDGKINKKFLQILKDIKKEERNGS